MFWLGSKHELAIAPPYEQKVGPWPLHWTKVVVSVRVPRSQHTASMKWHEHGGVPKKVGGKPYLPFSPLQPSAVRAVQRQSSPTFLTTL